MENWNFGGTFLFLREGEVKDQPPFLIASFVFFSAAKFEICLSGNLGSKDSSGQAAEASERIRTSTTKETAAPASHSQQQQEKKKKEESQ